MFKIQFKECHFRFTFRALQGVIAERKEDHFTPFVEAAQDGVF